MRINNGVCFICGDKKVRRETRLVDLVQLCIYKCNHCGHYRLWDVVGGHIESSQLDFFSKAPCIAFEMRLKKLDNYELTWNNDTKQACIGDIPFLAGYPASFPEKLDRILMNIARLTDFNPLHQTGSTKLSHAAFFLEEDVNYGYDASIDMVLELLKNEGLIEYSYNHEQDFCVNLTLQGAILAVELNSKTSDSKNAFLAMWFDGTTDHYKTSVHAAVTAAGYSLQVVNEVHHNDYIMDKVLNLIKESRFVIADLTCAPEAVANGTPSKGVRGGVYLEAGYAKGLCKQVIFTCHDDADSRNRIHFDVKQVNTVFWNHSEGGAIKAFGQHDFAEYLKERIIATVGKGPVPVPA